MPFDDKKWDKTAAQGDVGNVAINTSSALYAIRTALRNIKEGKDIDKQLTERPTG